MGIAAAPVSYTHLDVYKRQELVKRNVEYGRLMFTTDLPSVLDNVEVVFSAVGTPPEDVYKRQIQ